MNRHDTAPDTNPDADRLEIQRLRAMIAHNSDWLWEVDAQGRYTFSSEHSLTMLGYRPEELIGRTPFDLMPPAEAERVGAEFAAIIAERRPFAGLVNRNLRADGRIVVLETSGIPLFDERGALTGYRGIDRDITPAIGQLHPRQLQLEALYAAAPVALGLVDRESRFLNANRALTRLFVAEGQQLTGRLAGEVLPVEQLDTAVLFTRLEAGEGLVERPLEWVGRHYQATVQAVRDHDERIIGLTLALTDVSELERMRDELARANAELALANARLGALAETDHLTGLPNRRRFDEALLTEIGRAIREGWTLSLLLFDIDLFKAYNDHYGHQAGDECLRTLARLLRDGVFRPADLACRYGGEEFAVILPHTDAAAAEQVAQRLRERLEDAVLPHVRAPSGQITASMGIATFDGRQASAVPAAMPGEVSARLLDVADRCLYRAKREGRNRVSIAAL